MNFASSGIPLQNQLELREFYLVQLATRFNKEFFLVGKMMSFLKILWIDWIILVAVLRIYIHYSIFDDKNVFSGSKRDKYKNIQFRL